MSALPGKPIGSYEGMPLCDVTGIDMALVLEHSGGRTVAYREGDGPFAIEFIPDLPPVVHTPEPAVARFALHGYAARQWRKRLTEGEETKVVLSVLPRDAQVEIRRFEKFYKRAHARLTALHAAGGFVTLTAYFD